VVARRGVEGILTVSERAVLDTLALPGAFVLGLGGPPEVAATIARGILE